VAAGVSGTSFTWLVRRALASRRASWITEVGVPVALAATACVAFAPGPPLRSAGTVIAVALALGAGFVFAQGSPLFVRTGELHARSSPGGLLLWGAAMLLFVVAPAAGGGRTGVDAASGALGLIAASALLGQGAAALWRMLHVETLSSAHFVPRLQAVGAVAAAVAVILVWPGFRGTAVTGGTLLVGTPGLTPQLYFLDANGSGLRRVGLAGGGPRWMPDGKQFVFQQKKGTDFTEIWVANPDGGSPRRVVTVRGLILDLLSDGRTIYYVHGQSWMRNGLSAVPVGGGQPEQILPDTDTIWTIALSPDRRTLAHDNNDWGSVPEIRLLDLAARKITTIARDPSKKTKAVGLVWTPDGRALIASLTQVGTSQSPCRLERISVPDGRRTPVLAEVPYLLKPGGFAPDGGLLVVAVPIAAGQLQEPKAELWRVDPATGSRRTLQKSAGVTLWNVSPRPPGS
jgi:hypothetical protein